MLSAETASKIKEAYLSDDSIGYRTVAKDFGVSWKVVFNIVKKGTYHKVPSERFWEKVDARNDDECWPWLACLSSKGYGHIGWEGKVTEAHRVAYYLATDVWPGDLHVLHKCDNPRCCNPSHLMLGTHSDNMRDMKIKGRAKKREKRKFSPAEALEIKNNYAPRKYTVKKLAEDYGTSPSTICKILYDFDKYVG